MLQHRVVITGMGMVTCLGSGVEANWERFAWPRRSGIGPITLFRCERVGYANCRRSPRQLRSCRPHSHERIAPHGPLSTVCSGSRRGSFRAIRLALTSGRSLSLWRHRRIRNRRLGHHRSRSDRRSEKKGLRAVHPLTIPKAVINLAPGMLSIKYGFKGPNFGVVNACTSGTSAIGEAFRMVREGRADVMLSGGAEAVVTMSVRCRFQCPAGPVLPQRGASEGIPAVRPEPGWVCNFRRCRNHGA